jgi:hypothetical protein
MIRLEVFIWGLAALIINLVLLKLFEASWQFVVIVSGIIVILYVLRQVLFTGFFHNYRKELQKLFGPVQETLYSLEWVSPVLDSQGKHCDMYVFLKNVVFVSPNPMGKEQVNILEIELKNIDKVRLNQEGCINIIFLDQGKVKQLFLKTALQPDKALKALETLQAEIVQERKVRALQKVSEKAKQIDEELQRQKNQRRQNRLTKLQAEGQRFVKRFAELVPTDIFIKDSLFDKCKELITLEFHGRKSTLPGRLEEFLDNELKPFVEIIKEKAGFDYEDEEDLIILLNAIRAEVRQLAHSDFMDKFSNTFERIEGKDEFLFIDVFVRLCGLTGVKDYKNLEGFRLFLQNNGFEISLKELNEKNEICIDRMKLEAKKHGLEKKINSDIPSYEHTGDLDILESQEFADFIKIILTKPGDSVSEISISDNTKLIMVIEAEQKVIVNAVRPEEVIDIEDILLTEKLKEAKKAEVAMIITTSYFTNRAIKMAGSKGIILWDRIRLEYELQLIKDKG